VFEHLYDNTKLSHHCRSRLQCIINMSDTDIQTYLL